MVEHWTCNAEVIGSNPTLAKLSLLVCFILIIIRQFDICSSPKLNCNCLCFLTENPLHMSWHDSAGIPHLNQSNVMDYFAERSNPFYDRTCNNEMVKMQRAAPEQLKWVCTMQHVWQKAVCVGPTHCRGGVWVGLYVNLEILRPLENDNIYTNPFSPLLQCLAVKLYPKFRGSSP